MEQAPAGACAPAQVCDEIDYPETTVPRHTCQPAWTLALSGQGRADRLAGRWAFANSTLVELGNLEFNITQPASSGSTRAGGLSPLHGFWQAHNTIVAKTKG